MIKNTVVEIMRAPQQALRGRDTRECSQVILGGTGDDELRQADVPGTGHQPIPSGEQPQSSYPDPSATRNDSHPQADQPEPSATEEHSQSEPSVEASAHDHATPSTRHQSRPEDASPADGAHPEPDTARVPPQRDDADDDEPSQAELDSARAFYREWRKEVDAGWAQGSNIIGEAPDRFPGDTSDLPPTGEQLVEMESGESRAAAFRQELYKPEVIEGIHDAIEHDADQVWALLKQPPTDSHVGVPASRSDIGPVAPEHASASDLTMATLAFGVVLFEAARFARSKIDVLKGR